MRIRWTCSGCTDLDKRHIRQAWLDVRPGLEDRLQSAGVEAIELSFEVCREAGRNSHWRVNAVLKLAEMSYLADVRMSTCGIAVDECVALIAEQISEDPRFPLPEFENRQSATPRAFALHGC